MAGGKTFIRRRGQTAVPNQTIYAKHPELAGKDGEPDSLSIQALGLLLLMLSRPSGKASQGYRTYMGRGLGQVGLLSAMKELNVTGHRYQYKRRGPGGSIVTDTIVSEVPISSEEAEAEWRANVRNLGGVPVDNSESDRASETNATGGTLASTVHGFTDARSSGASSVPEAKVSKETSSQETGEDQKAEADEPAQKPEHVDNDASRRAYFGPGRAALRAKLDEARRAKGHPPVTSTDQKEVAPLRQEHEGRT